MKSRLSTRYFLIFGSLAVLGTLAAGLLLFIFNIQALEKERLKTYERTAESLAAVSDAVLRGRESEDVMRSALSIVETTLYAQVFVLADHGAPFTSVDDEPILRAAPLSLDGDPVYIRRIVHQGVPYSIYASPLPNTDGTVVIVDPDGAARFMNEAGFLMAVCVLGIALFMLILTGIAAQRQAAPIIALKAAVETPSMVTEIGMEAVTS